jgi:uncharacterized membrane protein
MTTKLLPELQRSAQSPRNLGWRAAGPGRRDLAGYAAALAVIALLVPLRGLWAVQVLLVPLLLVVPGVVLLRALRVPGRAVASFPVYVPCASIVVLFASGLAVNMAAPLVGVVPLRPWPLLAGLEITCLALLAASARAPSDVAIPWRSLGERIRYLWPLLVALAAAGGALRLNSGHSNTVAAVALAACAVILVAGVLFASRMDTTLLAIILYAAELATMWSYSLRGDLVYGFDISTEYYDLQQTVANGIWYTAHRGDAYGAMLSVTVMPAELHFLTGLPALLVLKVLYPVIGAMFPVAIFYLARRVLSARWAFAAAGFFVMQASFAEELPAIARQEIALVLFAALLAAVLDSAIPRRARWALVVLLGLAMVTAHYSTTYVAITIFGLAVVLQWLAHWVRRDIPAITGAFAIAFLVSLAGAFVWYGPVTHSAASELLQLGHSLKTNGLQLLPNRAAGQSPIGAYLQGNTATPMSAAQYQRLVHDYYAANIHYVTPLRDAGLPKYALRNSAPPVPPVTMPAVNNALTLGSVIVQQLVYLLGTVGALLMVVWRRTPVLARQVGLLSLATVFLLALIRLSGTLADTYNQERALLQSTAVLAVALFWLVERMAGRRRWRQALAAVIAAGGLTTMFFTTSGLSGVLFGGGTATNLANSGEDFERYYMTAPELASAHWLGRSVQPGQLVYADRYAQLPLDAVAGINRGVLGDVTPLTISQHAWVYAGRSNVVDGRGRALFDDHTVTYAFPASFLTGNYDLVYTDGSSEVFHR